MIATDTGWTFVWFSTSVRFQTPSCLQPTTFFSSLPRLRLRGAQSSPFTTAAWYILRTNNQFEGTSWRVTTDGVIDAIRVTLSYIRLRVEPRPVTAAAGDIPIGLEVTNFFDPPLMTRRDMTARSVARILTPQL